MTLLEQARHERPEGSKPESFRSVGPRRACVRQRAGHWLDRFQPGPGP